MQVSVGAAKKSAAKSHEINLIRPTASFAKKGGKDEQSASCPPPLSVASIRGAFRPVTGLAGSAGDTPAPTPTGGRKSKQGLLAAIHQLTRTTRRRNCLRRGADGSKREAHEE